MFGCFFMINADNEQFVVHHLLKLADKWQGLHLLHYNNMVRH
jgi:hypothetical protein